VTGSDGTSRASRPATTTGSTSSGGSSRSSGTPETRGRLPSARQPARRAPAHRRGAQEGRDGRRKPLADSTIQTILKPLRACLGQAVREGLIPSNPTRDLRLPKRETIDYEDTEDVRALTPDQLVTFLDLAPARHRLMFRFLAATGLRISEASALQWRHLHLDGSTPHVKVRRAVVRGRVEPPNTRHGRREVRTPFARSRAQNGPAASRSGRATSTSCSPA
jgi:integrase